MDSFGHSGGVVSHEAVQSQPDREEPKSRDFLIAPHTDSLTHSLHVHSEL